MTCTTRLSINFIRLHKESPVLISKFYFLISFFFLFLFFYYFL